MTSKRFLMQNLSNQSYLATRLFLIFVSAHLICWTIVPILVRYNLPLDSIEGATWGHQLQWGYDKNPFLNGWLTALAVYLSGGSDWTIYLFSQLSVGICFFAVFLLANKIVPPFYALIAVILLEGIQYYNFHAIDFNDNTLELCTWGLTSYFFYCATSTQAHTAKNISQWVLTGFFAALGMMAKYYTTVLLCAMFLFLIIQPDARKQLKTWPPYLGMAVLIAVMIPHIIWLFHHDFITVDYVFQRTNSDRNLVDHVFFPAQFAWQQFEALIPACVLFAVFFLRKATNQALTINAFNRAFLFYIGCGPFLLTLALACLLGIKLRAGWGMPLFSLFGLILMAFFRPQLSPKTIHRFFICLLTLMILLLMGYTFSLHQATTTSSANFPGKLLAQTITLRWREKYHTKLAYVAGPRWIGGNILFYSPDHPSVFMEWNKHKSPWINLSDLEKKGGVFVWEVAKEPLLTQEIQNRYPHLEGMETLTFSWQRGATYLPPIQIGVAYLPPRVS